MESRAKPGTPVPRGPLQPSRPVASSRIIAPPPPVVRQAAPRVVPPPPPPQIQRSAVPFGSAVKAPPVRQIPSHHPPAPPPIYYPGGRTHPAQPKATSVPAPPARPLPPPIVGLRSAPPTRPVAAHHPVQPAGKAAQRPVLPASRIASPSVQRYTTAGTQKLSQNSHYIVDSASDTILYVRTGATAPQPAALIVANGTTTAIGGVNYAQYHYNPANAFVNDCLSFSENLARGTDANSGRAEFRAVGDNPHGTDRLFGHSDAQNVSIAGGSWTQDEATDPAIGEAYAIARNALPAGGETPYHVALVVAKDGTDNVTLEADASVVRAAPIFDMYGTAANTFHEAYEVTYTSARGNRKKRKRIAPSTGVLRLRT
jgi:hypothetical protein